MKRILMITLEFPPQIGGIAVYVDALASELSRNHSVTVMAPLATQDHKSQYPYQVIRKNLLFPKFIWPRWLKLLLIVYRLLRKEQYDLIMLHHVLPVGYVAVAMKKRFGIPFLTFSHGTDVLLGTATTWKRNMLSRIVDATDAVIFNSQSLKHRFLRVLPEYTSKSVVLYPCPDQNFLTPPAAEELAVLRAQLALDGKQVLLSVGRMVDGKGFPHMLRILPDLLTHIPNLVWVVIGSGPKQKELILQAQKATLQSVVRFIGDVPHEKLKPFYYLADAFVLLTHPDEGREEGLGLVFLEAAAARLPIVAGRSGGVEEAIVHTKTGLLIDTQQTKQVVEALTSMLTNKPFAQMLAQNAQERIQSEFVWQNQLSVLKKWLT